MPQTSSPHIPQANFDHSYFNLDPSATKQIPFLNAANMARIANGRSAASSAPQPAANIGAAAGSFVQSTTNDTSNGIIGMHPNFQIPGNNPLPQAPTVDPSVSQPSQAARNPTQGVQSLKQRQRNFLMGLANVMANRNTPLPPALTGIPYPPNYDTTTSPWKIIEPSTTELGSFRLAGKDVDLFKLWGIVYQAGGGNLVRALGLYPNAYH